MPDWKGDIFPVIIIQKINTGNKGMEISACLNDQVTNAHLPTVHNYNVYHRNAFLWHFQFISMYRSITHKK